MSKTPIWAGKGSPSVIAFARLASAETLDVLPPAGGRKSVARHSWLAVFACALTWLVSGGVRVALADNTRFDVLCRTLNDDANYKVRLQAAIVLGKLRDQRAVACLTEALSDTNHAVRAMAATSLGQIGDAHAIPALQALRKSDADPFVRSNVDKALGLLASGAAIGGGPVRSGAHLYVTFGPFSGGTKNAGADLIKNVRETLAKELAKTPSLAVAPEPGDDKTFQKQGLLGFYVDGNITRIDETPSGAGLEVSCAIKVMVARWPSRSIISWTSAEASLQSGSRPKDRENAHRDCLEATAGQLAEDLAKFFKAQGG
jgi:hypothetical protein